MSDGPEVAYYYPPPYWGGQDHGWVKSLLLFFDQIAILLPNYMYGLHTAADEATVIPLEESGLLRVLDPDDWVDQETAENLTEVMVDLLAGDAFEDVPKHVPFEPLSQSRLGYSVDVGLADMLVEELLARGLAQPSENKHFIPLHPTVRTTILVLLGQLSRLTGARRGLVIHPVTNMPNAIDDLIDTLSLQRMPSTDQVIKLDLEPVSLDLSDVPLNELLEFRAEHREAHRMYAANLHMFMTELAQIDDIDERAQLLSRRRQEIDDAASDLRRARFPWAKGKRSSFGIGIAGAVWSLLQGDLVGAGFGVGGAVSDRGSTKHSQDTAYSYTFEIGERFGRSKARQV